MTFEEMRKYIKESVEAFPSIKVLVFTGGECTLLGNDLLKAIKYGKSLGLLTRVVTNAHWAKTEEKAVEFVKQLAESGLDEIDFSTGDEHQQFVPLSNIIKALKASCNNNAIIDVVVSVEEAYNSFVDIKEFVNSISCEDIPKEKLLVLSSPWIKFRELNNENPTKQNKDAESTYKGCSSIFGGININPDGQLLACCGLPCEYSPFLKIGNSKCGIEKTYKNQFNDLLKLWLYTDGPFKIYSEITGKSVDFNKHDCEYCIKLLTNPLYLNNLLNVDKRKIQTILFNYNFKLSKYEKTKKINQEPL